jgi:hypothetical protein
MIIKTARKDGKIIVKSRKYQDNNFESVLINLPELDLSIIAIATEKIIVNIEKIKNAFENLVVLSLSLFTFIYSL